MVGNLLSFLGMHISGAACEVVLGSHHPALMYLFNLVWNLSFIAVGHRSDEPSQLLTMYFCELYVRYIVTSLNNNVTYPVHYYS